MLTIVTQIGGIVYLLSHLYIKRNKKYFQIKRVLFFLGLYLLMTFLIVPIIAPVFGRQKIENNSQVSYHNVLTVLCNRNYVTKELHKVLVSASSQFQKSHPSLQLIYLDANFPFFDGFPLLPHLSHNDGKKIDLAFIYRDSNGNPTNAKPSHSGYGFFEEPKSGEISQTKICKETGHWQYDYPKYLTFGSQNDLILDKEKTTQLIQILSQNSSVQKIFIEPHLKKRWNLTSSKIRFQGCRAVRHDDHIHMQIH
jgi:hypothetical protein